MRLFLTVLVTLVVTGPSFIEVVAGRMSPDDFGIRFLAGVIFAMCAVGLMAVFINAANGPDPSPQRRKTDKSNAS